MGIITVVLDDIKIKTDILFGGMDRKDRQVFSFHGQRPFAFVIFEHGDS